MQATAVKYRPDIDGLRALAILPVVWFHSDLPGLGGGFTGVDTFFVISGYLITLIIHREVAGGRFSFARFYERRVRRIAPALLLVTATATVAGYVLLLPYELVDFGASALAALAMVSNVYFWRTGGYFALADGITPLLHTWSLGVEEQFYLLFPAALLVSERFNQTRRAIALLAAASFALCLLATARSPAAAFYLLPPRGWELMIGAGLAVGLLAVPERLKGPAGAAGVAMLIAAAFFLTEAEPFPGWRALLPTIGAGLVIGAGPATVANRLLSIPPLIYVGRISYSLYLWHWPVFVFLRHWRADPHLPPLWSLAGIALAVGLAALSYHWIERPARDRSRAYRSVVIPCVAAAAVISLVCGLAWFRGGFPQRLPTAVAKLAARHDAFAPLAHACTDIGFEAALVRCHLGPPGPPTFVLWGDSHAAAISEGVAGGLRQPGVVLSTGACPPLIGWTNPQLRGRDPEICRTQNDRALQWIEGDPQVRTIVLSAYWESHARVGGAAFWRAQQRLIDQLREDGKRVVLIAGIPEPGADVPWTSAIRARFGRDPLQLQCPRAVLPLVNATIVDVSAAFCGKPPAELFTDSNHISREAGLQIIAPALRGAGAKQ